jgi:hypothetical protein
VDMEERESVSEVKEESEHVSASPKVSSESALEY